MGDRKTYDVNEAGIWAPMGTTWDAPDPESDVVVVVCDEPDPDDNDSPPPEAKWPLLCGPLLTV